MRELKLKYFLDLVSNVGTKAQADAQLMQKAQEAMNAAIVGTNNKFLDYNKLAVLAGKNTGLMQEVITGATNKFVALERAMQQAGRDTSMERQLSYMQRLSHSLEGARTRVLALRAASKEMLASGIANAPEAFAAIASGAYGAGRVLTPPVRNFANRETAQTDLALAMMDRTGTVAPAYNRIQAEAIELGKRLPGGTKDFMAGARALKEQGVPDEVIANGGLRASSYFGALMSMDQYQGATTIAKVREAFGLKDEELVQMADIMQRGRYAFGIAPTDFLEVAKYAAPTYNTLGLTGIDNARKLIAIQGIAAQVGLENSSFGTNFSQMLQRTAQIDWRLNRKGKEAQEIKALLGENNIDMQFFDSKGEFGGVENMLGQLAKLRPLSTHEQMKVLNKMFGVEAGRPAQILAQKGVEAYRESLGRMDSQASLDQRIEMKMDTFAAKLEALGGVIEDLTADMAAQIGRGAKPVMDATGEVLGGPLQSFFKNNPTAGTASLVTGSALSAYLVGRLGVSAVKALAGRVAGGVALEGAATGSAAAAGSGLLLPAATVGAGAFAGWQSWRLLSAFQELYQAKNRQGVTLSPYARRRLAGQPEPTPMDLSQVGMPGGDFLTLTTPGGGSQALGMGRAAEVKVGEGRLDVLVRVSDERVSATTSVAQPLSLVRINPGNTNPAGYMGGAR